MLEYSLFLSVIKSKFFECDLVHIAHDLPELLPQVLLWSLHLRPKGHIIELLFHSEMFSIWHFHLLKFQEFTLNPLDEGSAHGLFIEASASSPDIVIELLVELLEGLPCASLWWRYLELKDELPGLLYLLAVFFVSIDNAPEVLFIIDMPLLLHGYERLGNATLLVLLCFFDIVFPFLLWSIVHSLTFLNNQWNLLVRRIGQLLTYTQARLEFGAGQRMSGEGRAVLVLLV